MVSFDIRRLVPHFIWEDRNGHALAVAIARGMNIMCGVIQSAVDCVFDVSKMPEWRLDEMAWELGCLYDYTAPIETKRRWIENAIPIFAAYGTIAAMHEYLDAYFDSLEVEEAHQYGGEPYHFRIIGVGEWTEDKKQWLTAAVERVKNVRSVLDGAYPGRTGSLQLTGERRVWPSPVPFPGEVTYTGTIPGPATIGQIRGAELDTEAEAHNYPVLFAPVSEDTATGTFPNISTESALSEAQASIPAEVNAYQVLIPYASEDFFTEE